MAYIPPHKRNTLSSSSSALTPTPLPSFKQQNTHSKSSFTKNQKSSTYLLYAKDSISKWVPIGLSSADDDDKQLQFMTHLEPLSSESPQPIFTGEKLFALVLNDHTLEEGVERAKKFLADPWNLVAVNVKQDLFSSFERVKNEMLENETERVRPALVARIGKILFHRRPSSDEDANERNSMSESALRKLRKTFYANVPSSYVDYVISEVVPTLGLCFVSEKELYHVKISDNKRHDIVISCKCIVGKDHGKLELHKVELNAVRHFVVDMSCLDKNLDLRLMLCTKRTVAALTASSPLPYPTHDKRTIDFLPLVTSIRDRQCTYHIFVEFRIFVSEYLHKDDEFKIIKRLVSYAILDPEVKGGLRWPLGKNSSGDRYTVVGVWHTTAKSYGNSSVRVKIRQADRFDFKSSIGEYKGEVIIKMHGIVSQLLEQEIQTDVISTMLKENLKLIWEHCLNGSGR